VYRGLHERTSQAAAVKTVRVPRAELLLSIRREIHALLRASHPGVVRIVEAGLQDAEPWFAMEIVEGRSLRQLVGAAGGRPEPLEGLLTVVRRLCAPLAYLHGEGLVHRDLKPENVLIRPDGMPVLVDFGLMSQCGGELSRESLAEGGGAVGTPHYMAPEQIRGELVDARADLYALGCILHELLTGQPPFPGASGQDVLRRHLEEAPRPPSELVEGIPPELDEIVLGLLSKRPRDRTGHAHVVAAALEQLGAAPAPAVQAGPTPRAYLYRPGFAGRAAPMQALGRLLERLRSGGGAAVLIGGESGVGKTRLLMELCRQARQGGLEVLPGECSPPSALRAASEGAGSLALEALRKPLQALADRCREAGAAETQRLLSGRGRVLGLYEPALLELPGQRSLPEPPELPPEAARLRLYRFLSETWAALARDRLLLLALDDLQWADELTLGFLELLVRSGELKRTRLLVVGTYRSEEAGPALERLLQVPGVLRPKLERLDPEALGSIVADMLALAPPPAPLVRLLERHSEGNPFFVAEYLRAAVGDGLLYRDEAGRWQLADSWLVEDAASAPGLPVSIRELVERRLAALAPEARLAADGAAVLGRELDPALLAQVTRLDGTALLEAIQALLTRHVLEETPAPRLRFLHDKIREALYGDLEVEARRRLHRAAAEALEARPGSERSAHLAELGHHWKQAGERTAARRCYLAAAREAASRYALQEAERLYRAGLALTDELDQESLEAWFELGWNVLHVRGHGAEFVRELGQVLEGARRLASPEFEARCLRALGNGTMEQGRMEEARAYLEQALALQQAIGDRAGMARTLINLTRHSTFGGRLEEAAATGEQALALSREARDRPAEAKALGLLGPVYYSRGALHQARSAYERSLAIHRELGDRYNQGIVLGNLALVWHEQGHLEEAGRLLEQSVAIHREVGSQHFEGKALNNLAILRDGQGRREEARKLFERALAIHRSIGNRREEGIVLTNLAKLQADAGLLETARKMYGAALRLHRECGHRHAEGQVLLEIATSERQCGRLEKAERLLRRAEALIEALGEPIRLALCRCERGHLALARGEPARESLDAAQALAAAQQMAPQSELALAATRLRKAVEAFEAGQQARLFRGELVEVLPEGLRRRLAGGERRERP
jgi:tetratricopeptide (TPR) repeat protein